MDEKIRIVARYLDGEKIAVLWRKFGIWRVRGRVGLLQQSCTNFVPLGRKRNFEHPVPVLKTHGFSVDGTSIARVWSA